MATSQLFAKKMHSDYGISESGENVVPFDMVRLPVFPRTSCLKILVENVQAILELRHETWVFLSKIFTRYNDLGIW
jgi:hypothetical protein